MLLGLSPIGTQFMDHAMVGCHAMVGVSGGHGATEGMTCEVCQVILYGRHAVERLCWRSPSPILWYEFRGSSGVSPRYWMEEEHHSVGKVHKLSRVTQIYPNSRVHGIGHN